MDELLAITPLAHYPWYSQFRLANYYSRVLNVSVRIHIENYIASEDILFINLSIAIVYQNLVNIFRKYSCAPRRKNEAMTVVEAGRIASRNSTGKLCTHPTNRIHEHCRYARRLHIWDAGAFPGVDNDGVHFLTTMFFIACHIKELRSETSRRRSRPVRSSLVRATFLIVGIQYRHNVLYRPALRQSDGPS